jgi:hypothetical protein
MWDAFDSIRSSVSSHHSLLSAALGLCADLIESHSKRMSQGSAQEGADHKGTISLPLDNVSLKYIYIFVPVVFQAGSSDGFCPSVMARC